MFGCSCLEMDRGEKKKKPTKKERRRRPVTLGEHHGLSEGAPGEPQCATSTEATRGERKASEGAPGEHEASTSTGAAPRSTGGGRRGRYFRANERKVKAHHAEALEVHCELALCEYEEGIRVTIERNSQVLRDLGLTAALGDGLEPSTLATQDVPGCSNEAHVESPQQLQEADTWSTNTQSG